MTLQLESGPYTTEDRVDIERMADDLHQTRADVAVLKVELRGVKESVETLLSEFRVGNGGPPLLVRLHSIEQRMTSVEREVEQLGTDERDAARQYRQMIGAVVIALIGSLGAIIAAFAK